LLQFEIVIPTTAASMHAVAKYYITFTLKCFALALVAVVAVSAELRAILLNKICKILLFLCYFVNSAHDSQFCAHWPILRMQYCRIL